MSHLEMTGERFVPELRGQIYYEHIHRYALASRFVSGKSVIDMASGEGYGSAILAQSATTVVGIDVSEKAIEHARKNYYVSNLRFLCAPCEAIPLADASADIVVSFETIEHVNDYRQMLREIRRVLKPSGALIISSPNKLIYTDKPQHENPFHVSELYYNEFRDALAVHFDCVEIFGQRIAAASVISPLASATSSAAQWLSGGIHRIETGLPALQEPVYFVAICSTGQIQDADLSSAFVDPENDLLHDIWIEVTRLRQQVNPLVLSSTHAGAVSGVTVKAVPSFSPVRIVEPDNSCLEQKVGSDSEQLLQSTADVTSLREELERERLKVASLQVRLDLLSSERDDIDHERQSAVQAYELSKTSLRAENDRLRTATDAALTALQHLRGELDRLECEGREFQAMRASRSWRLTAPLRLLARGIVSSKPTKDR
jgi:ubiquinone/menaquinone biosynthesis C-methylase UbiE